MRVVVTGASGLVGSALVPYLAAQRHETDVLSRNTAPGHLVWNPQDGSLDPALLKGVEAIVHLAGANIAAGRWTSARKKEIRDSRLGSTRLLVDTFRRLDRPPRVLVCSSAIGFYGDTGEKIVAEDSAGGSGFLADLCREWEAEAARAEELGTRVVRMRTGVILSPKGGALAKVLPVFRAGFGGPIGGGKQWMSWISIDDAIAVIQFLMAGDSISGPVNAVAPMPVTNSEFAHALGHALSRPAIAPVPATVLKLMYGKMAEETILASTRVVPQRLTGEGFQFRHPELEGALNYLLKE